MLSIAGRISLLKASISSLPLCYLSLFVAPKAILEKINKLQRRFLWSGGTKKASMALVSWQALELPK